jgi:hypothetical protein
MMLKPGQLAAFRAAVRARREWMRYENPFSLGRLDMAYGNVIAAFLVGTSWRCQDRLYRRIKYWSDQP